MKITGIITTLNESKNIEACIRSLQRVCDEVIVTDSCSTDNTVELAEKAGARVFVHPYIGDGPQKNLPLEHAKNDWVLSLDADERLTDELVAAIQQLDLEHTPYDGFAIRRRNYIGERWVKACNWYPDWLVRLYRKDKLRFLDRKQHAFVPEKNTKRLKADIIHYRYKNSTASSRNPSATTAPVALKSYTCRGRRPMPSRHFSTDWQPSSATTSSAAASSAAWTATCSPAPSPTTASSNTRNCWSSNGTSR